MKNPIPQGKYVPATRWNDLIFTAGMTPRRDGVLQFSGKIQAEEPLEAYREAVRIAAGNALTAAQNQLKEGEAISRVLSLTVYLNAEQGFTAHSKIADFASDYLTEQLGAAATAARTSIGIGTLPGNAPVEIAIICAVAV